MESIVIKVVIDDALSDSVVLIGIFDHGLLEITEELKHLLVVLKPFGSDFRDGIVFLGWTLRDAG